MREGYTTFTDPITAIGVAHTVGPYFCIFLKLNKKYLHVFGSDQIPNLWKKEVNLNFAPTVQIFLEGQKM